MKTLNNNFRKKRTRKLINIIKVLLFITIITTPLLSISQSLSDNGEIELPDVDFTPSPSVDIIKAGNFIYVYTFKGIQIYEEDEDENTIFMGSIDFGNEHGRFAPMYYDLTHYAVDPVLMAHDPTNHLLYFVTPELTIQSVNTLSLDTDPADVSLPLQFNIDNRTLHAYTKLVYDKGRLFWLFRTMDNNLHSFDAYFGVFEKGSNGTWSDIYQESQNGSDTLDYINLMNTFTVNTDNGNNDFYMARKFKIEQWSISQGSASKITDIETPNQQRNSKLLYISSKNLLLAFPLSLFEDNDFPLYIYQINTQTFTDNHDNRQLSPSKKILDAIYISDGDNDNILVCYGNDGFVQLEEGIDNDIDGDETIEPDHDVASYHFNSSPDKMIFTLSDLITTQSADEIDINITNLNRPFKLINAGNGNALVGKKNDIVLLSDLGNLRYEASNVYYARDNFFGKGTSVDAFGNFFIMNVANSGFEKINNEYERLSTIKTTYPVYNTVYNHLNRKLYFFNRLGTENTGFFAYDLESGDQTFVETSKAIGDLIYNPIKNHILVSEYAPTNDGYARINVINADDLTNVSTLTFTGEDGSFDYPGRMFAAPNGKLYISMNMRDNGNNPEIAVIDGSNYQEFFYVESGLIAIPITNCDTYQSFYCYNPYNEKVYATFGPYIQSIDQPYQTSYNCGISTGMEPYGNPTSYGGKLIKFGEDDQSTLRYNIERPNEIICSKPISQQNNKDYEGVLFINSNSEDGVSQTLSDLNIFDCKTASFITLPEEEKIRDIYDMDYCPLTGCLYTISHEVIEGVPDQKYIHVYKVNEDGSYTNIMQEDFEGTASSINYNEFDSQLYIYDRGKYKMLGVNNAKIHTLDPFAESNAIPESIDLPYKNMFPEMVPQANHPHFDPYNNKAYFPNGMHSSVSVVGFTPKEALALRKDTDWLSIPRLPANDGTDWNQYVATSTVWDANNFQIPYIPIDDDNKPPLLYHWHTEASEIVEEGEEPYSAYYKNLGWDYLPDEPDNKSTWSYRGYQLNVVPDGDNYIYMTGNIKDPATSFPLYNGKKNWVGYFLPGEQDIFDALGASTLENLSSFKHRDYYCYRGPAIEGPTGGIVNGYPWRCDQQQTNIAYGDMVQLKVIGNIADFDMIWQNPGSTPRDKIRPEPDHFEFAETGTYTPILIELDYTNNPLEIGVFVDDSCVGAESVMESDTVIILRAYLNGGNLDSVVFQDWDGTKSAGRIIKDYTVYNPNTGIYENRALMSNTDEEMPRVSFREKNKEKENGLVDHKIGIWPNPTANVLNYSFACEDKTDVKVALLDVSGRQIKLLLDQRFSKGFYHRTAILSRSIVGLLAPGVYFVRFDIGGYIVTKKLVIN